MPYERWRQLSHHGQRICRYVMCGEGEAVIGAGFTHPRAKAREQYIQQQLSSLGPGAADEWARRR